MNTHLAALIALLPAVLSAQQQTGASAGIPVPQPPAVTSGTATSAEPGTAVFRIRVVDGRNGAAMQGAHVNVWYDEAEGAGTMLTTDATGTANLPAPLGQPTRVLVNFDDLVDCRKGGTNSVPTGFNLQTLAAHGQSADNTCGSIAERTKPGELVLFARKPRWYEGINRNIQR